MPCPGRKHQTVPRRDLDGLTAGTANQQGGAATCHSEHLMRAGMVVLIIEDTVCPDVCPTAFREATFEITTSVVVKKPLVK